MLQKFEFRQTKLKGAYNIKPFFAEDERGALIKDYNCDVFKDNGIEHELREVFYTVSKKGVIRAIHFQKIKQQAKLVRCISGHIYDVIVDLRKGSATLGQWQGFHLTGENRESLFIPEYFGHGYLVLEDSVVSYKCGEVFCGEYDTGIMWNDSDIGIEWPLSSVGGIGSLIISDKDMRLQSFKEYLREQGCL
ncbi:dTDP-4-dehydrorhamnose 3,5-epimerase [Ruminiclostridium sufflavum DSM 19573]|uniref:dTDP-4-dehydrorhamnose 3,5-epimerase n=1 Tax=Ruminiclostridium sufflavum DSM 19573 TaxID=1121337 RepID=A0A318XPW1_9FIRM|nr:dTDP-4-dehydrorhamnose 3,5-epimerase [Ruminiclostridium sufflavum]PYG87795.1 dTDP-4-dehydrorhamnose 3,5-epimerase [Ruminiclostridium sufflavum DSM 19573]